MIKVASNSNNEVFWFVKSASPEECGGPYHANVAQDLIEWIKSVGFPNIQVTGGGRIDYDPDRKRAHVYVFSYGHGKENQAIAAELIQNEFSGGEMTSTVDNSDSLYYLIVHFLI